MALRLLGMMTVAAVLVLAGDLPQAEAIGPVPAPGLFQNYYAPTYYGGPVAQMYPSPRPVPPYVGWTYITYQGLVPHEFLYKHHRNYMTRHPDGSWTRTMITWH